MNAQYCACRTDALRIFVRSLIAPAPPQWRQFSGLASRQNRSPGPAQSTFRRMEALASLPMNKNIQASGVRYYARRSSRKAEPEPMMTSTDAFLDAMEGRPAKTTEKKGNANRQNNRMDKLGGGRSNRSNQSNRSGRSGGMQEQRAPKPAEDFPVVTLASLDAKKTAEPAAKKAEPAARKAEPAAKKAEPAAKTLSSFTSELFPTAREDKRDAQQRPKQETETLRFEKFETFVSERPRQVGRPKQVEKPEEKLVKTRGPWAEDQERDDVGSMLYEPDQSPRTQRPPRSATPAVSPLERTPRAPMERPPADAEPWKIQKYALRQKFPEGWNPRKKLSPDAHDGIRALNKQFPETYTTKALAEHFKVSPEAIRRILKSRWRPSAEEEEDRQERWFERGKQVWSRWAELGRKPPKRWQAEGIRRDASWAGKRQRQQEWRAEMDGVGEKEKEADKTQSQGKRMRLQLDKEAEASG